MWIILIYTLTILHVCDYFIMIRTFYNNMYDVCMMYVFMYVESHDSGHAYSLGSCCDMTEAEVSRMVANECIVSECIVSKCC